jgi:DNA polymerase I
VDKVVKVFDIETNGLLKELTKLHCISSRDATSAAKGWTDHPHPSKAGGLKAAIEYLNQTDVLVGHNILKFDLKALKKLGISFRPGILFRDTMVLAALFYPRDELVTQDLKRYNRGTFPGQHIGSHALEAWGYRLNILKGTYKGGWENWSPDMQDYAVQDSEVTWALWLKCCERAAEWGLDILDPNPVAGQDCIQLEHDVAEIIGEQEERGICFDTAGALKLHGKLSAEEAEIRHKLALAFPPKTHTTTKVMQATNSRYGYVKGQPFTKSVVVPFDPGSRRQASQRLMELGWSPVEFTKDGSPKLDDDTLRDMEYPEAQLLADYYTVTKLRGYLAEGKEAWIKHERQGRIHGRVFSNGAVTGRMTHSSPNLANIPSSKAKYGKECRQLFRASPGQWLVGIDADGLELRCLAHYMARYDEGAYIRAVLEGNKDLGTDMHTLNAIALGLPPKELVAGKETGRDIAKTWFYAFIYGAGDWKLGFTRTKRRTPLQQVANAGKSDKAKFLKGLPAMGKLVEAIGKKAKREGWVRGLDGRRIPIRAAHAALNTVLQSAGAILMKRALVMLHRSASATFGAAFGFVVNVHDEWQIEAKTKEMAVAIGKLGCDAITNTGVFYSFRCPLKGNADVGQTWADTH